MWVIIENSEPKSTADRVEQLLPAEQLTHMELPHVEQLPHIDEALQLEALQLEIGPTARRWRPSGPWAAQGLLAILLGIFLPLQYMWQHQSHLLQNPMWRPASQAICSIARCALPPRTDLTALRNERLRVAPHSTNSDYLQVDMQLFNAAPFSQPFPVLELSFTDIRGQVVAADLLQPADYLPAANLPAAQLLAANSMRPLTLTLLNPGEHAVNYQLALRNGSTARERKLSWSLSANEAKP